MNMVTKRGRIGDPDKNFSLTFAEETSPRRPSFLLCIERAKTHLMLPAVSAHTPRATHFGRSRFESAGSKVASFSLWLLSPLEGYLGGHFAVLGDPLIHNIYNILPSIKNIYLA